MSVRLGAMLEKHMRLVKFTLSSLACSGVDLALFALLYALLEPIAPGYAAGLATLAARVVSGALNFIINRAAVFRSEGSAGKQLAGYTALSVLRVLVSAVLIQLLEPFAKGIMVPLKAAIDTALFFASYALQKAIVFREAGR